MYRRLQMLPVLAAVLGSFPCPAAEYDPLAVTDPTPMHRDLTVKDVQRQREIPVRVYLPHSDQPAPVVLFSHGLGGSRTGCGYLGDHWAARGLVVVFLQHHGSDEAVWKDKPLAERMTALRQAANLQNFLARVEDVKIVLKQLEQWSRDPTSPLTGRVAMDRVGMSGHSFGAVTAQAVSGQTFAGSGRFTDGRIKAAVLMSPSPPRRGGDPAQAFGGVKIPWMLLTGTKDNAPLGEADAKSRLTVFPALPPRGKFELVLNKAEHSAFTDRRLPGDAEPRNPNHHRAILAVTSAFWDAYLRDDRAARDWLAGHPVHKVLEVEDRWQVK